MTKVIAHDYLHPLDDPNRHIENWHEFYKSEEHKLWKYKMEQEIADWLGFVPCHRLVEGYKIALVVHQRKSDSTHYIIDKETGERRESSIAVAEKTIEEDKWINPVGRVISMGAEAYMTGRWEDGTLRPRCKLGEYIHFPRHDGYMIKYRERPIMVMADDRIGGKVESPDYVSKY